MGSVLRFPIVPRGRPAKAQLRTRLRHARRELAHLTRANPAAADVAMRLIHRWAQGTDAPPAA